ncbi:peptidoglycan-binding LysM [Hydrogenophaga taeniospiralis CCUG 15921]|uniref:Peptidoglycan-binding LysM n=1 Tax=Hydrogenophaga taeniospiralis CCUG 15921 TaxID=1281780 RepID=A0A9X4SBW6_9BURK|nr:LysM domain-containing protein [Hydrogenophaga taeniospiralis]MDG5975963.1 peptidoglycan-binding LysM [Hydrogenophaga taeniospiralis CCUG 15921]
MPLKTCASANFHPIQTLRPLACAVAVFATLASATAWAQNHPITQDQRATANLVAESGVPLHELAPNAPDSHTVKRGDTLWGISSIFLQSPWRWPELWGMNMQDIRNPHLIYPGQVLYLDKSGGRARLSTRRPGDNGEPQTVRVSPRTRYEGLSESAIPPISLQAIEAFLTEPLIVDEATFARAPRIVAAKDSRVLLSRGDRAYARSFYGDNAQTEVEPLSTASGQPRDYRVFRNAVPLKDPSTGEVLAYEAQYVGKAFIVRGESRQAAAAAPAKVQPAQPATQDVYTPQFERTAANIERDKPAASAAAPAKPPVGEIVPATIDIVSAKEEMRVGDRLLPEPPREFPHYVPAAPSSTQTGQIVSVYGNAVTFAAQNQVVAINRGREHGIERGHVLALLSDSNTLVDKTDDSRPTLRLPGERNGLMMVFRTFDKVSYALVLQIADGVKVGDRFTNP